MGYYLTWLLLASCNLPAARAGEGPSLLETPTFTIAVGLLQSLACGLQLQRFSNLTVPCEPLLRGQAGIESTMHLCLTCKPGLLNLGARPPTGHPCKPHSYKPDLGRVATRPSRRNRHYQQPPACAGLPVVLPHPVGCL